MKCKRSINLQVKEALVFRCVNNKRAVSYGLNTNCILDGFKLHKRCPF